jgi:hypothetical protein
MHRHFSSCAICGAIGHTAKHCSLRELEERKDPLGEQKRREAMYQRRRELRLLRLEAAQRVFLAAHA